MPTWKIECHDERRGKADDTVQMNQALACRRYPRSNSVVSIEIGNESSRYCGDRLHLKLELGVEPVQTLRCPHFGYQRAARLSTYFRLSFPHSCTPTTYLDGRCLLLATVSFITIPPLSFSTTCGIALLVSLSSNIY